MSDNHPQAGQTPPNVNPYAPPPGAQSTSGQAPRGYGAPGSYPPGAIPTPPVYSDAAPVSAPPFEAGQGPRPPLSTVTGIVVIGVLSLIGALMFLIGVLNSDTYDGIIPARLFILGVGLGMLVLGAVLAVASLRGKRGGWLTIVSSLLAAFLVPAAIMVGAFVNASTTSWDEGDGSAGWGFEDTSSERTYVESQSADFGWEDNTIIALNGDVTIDLTDAPERRYGYIDINLDSESTLTVIMNPDQALMVEASGASAMTYTVEAPSETIAEYPWLALLSSLENRMYVESDAYLDAGYTGITLYISGGNSTVTFVIADTEDSEEEPQS